MLTMLVYNVNIWSSTMLLYNVKLKLENGKKNLYLA